MRMDILVVCASCGNSQEITDLDFTRENDLKVTAEVCEYCTERERDLGKQEGRDEAEAERA